MAFTMCISICKCSIYIFVIFVKMLYHYNVNYLLHNFCFATIKKIVPSLEYIILVKTKF